MPKVDHEKQLLFKCCCHGHIFEVFWDEDDDESVWFHYYSNTSSLWSALKWWFTSGRCWNGDVLLDKKDLIEIRDVLNKYVK